MISTLIFDLGNVILPISYERCAEAFSQLFHQPLTTAFFTSGVPKRIFEEQEIGKLSDEAFAEAFRNYGSIHASDQAVYDAWNTILGEIPPSRFALLERLRKTHHIYLLSNTNSVHQKVFEQRVLEQTGGKPLTDFFDKIYYSHRMGLRKPHPECYQFVLNDAQLEATKTLFIDDNKDNIIAASSLGIHALHLEAFDQLEEMLNRILK